MKKLHDVLEKKTSLELLKIIEEASMVLNKRTVKPVNERFEEHGNGLQLFIDNDETPISMGSFDDLMAEVEENGYPEWMITTKHGEIIADSDGMEQSETQGYDPRELQAREQREKDDARQSMMAKYTPQQVHQMIVDRVKASPEFVTAKEDYDTIYDLVEAIIQKLGVGDIVDAHLYMSDIIEDLGVKRKNFFEKYPNMLRKAAGYLADDISKFYPDKNPADSVIDTMRRFRITPDHHEWHSLIDLLYVEFERQQGCDMYHFFDNITDDVAGDGNFGDVPRLASGR